MKATQDELKKSNPFMYYAGMVLGYAIAAPFVILALLIALSIVVSLILLICSPVIALVLVIMFLTGAF